MSEMKTLNHLEDIVMETARAKKDEIDSEIKKIKQEHLSSVESNASKQCTDKVNAAISEIKITYQKKLSDAVYNDKKALIDLRTELENSVFEQVKNKLMQFVCTDEYQIYLENALSNVKDQCDEDKLQIYCAEKDIKLIQSICNNLKLDSAVILSNEITIGGFKAVCQSKSFAISNTFDSKLLELHEYFEQISALTII